MSRLKSFFDALEEKFYHTNREKISFNIGLLMLLHLLSTATLLYFAFKAMHSFRQLPDNGQAGEMLASIPGFIIVGIVLFVVALLVSLFIDECLERKCPSIK